jgi:uncharacterized hydrophobic protein (TIGR00271 family)
MVHLRIVAPAALASQALAQFAQSEAVIDVVHLAGAARQPDGDLIMCDVAREEASEVLSDLRDLGIDRAGSISVQSVHTALSGAARAAERAAPGRPQDAVVWEEVESQTSESTSLGGSFLLFMVLATLIAGVGIYTNSTVLIVGAMILGPDFGPVAGFSVATVRGEHARAGRSLLALVVGFVVAIVVAYVVTLVLQDAGAVPEHFSGVQNTLVNAFASPGFFALYVALLAGVAGTLSLTTAKSGPLIGVLVSVTTIPAAANIAVAGAYGNGSTFRGSLGQLAINVGALLVAGTATLAVQRALYRHRRARYERRRTEPGAS